jgi:hypothetical protein
METVFAEITLDSILADKTVLIGALYAAVAIRKVDRLPVLQIAVVRVVGADPIPLEVATAADCAGRTACSTALETSCIARLAGANRVSILA